MTAPCDDRCLRRIDEASNHRAAAHHHDSGRWAVAANGWPGLGQVLIALLGGTLSAGGANVINQVYDADIDQVMKRTSKRPLPTDRGRRSVGIGVSASFLGLLGFLVLGFGDDVARRLPQPRRISGIRVRLHDGPQAFLHPEHRAGRRRGGLFPALIGYAAVTGNLSIVAWLMFGIIFYWTPAALLGTVTEVRVRLPRSRHPHAPRRGR